MGWGDPQGAVDAAEIPGGPDRPEPVRALVEQMSEAVERWARYPSRANAERMEATGMELAAMVRIHIPRPSRPVVYPRR